MAQGGSTITQPAVAFKVNMLLTSERSMTRKLKEAVMSLSLEWHYTAKSRFWKPISIVFLGQDNEEIVQLWCWHCLGFILIARWMNSSYMNPRS
ncbi:MAG: transglycosylase domain-containing protein [Thiotrichaceae bacterium]